MEFFNQLNKNKNYILFQIVLLFLLFNYLFSNFNYRKDMSRFKRFNLTESTEKLVKNLPEKLYINAFFSSNIPSEYKARMDLVKEMIKEIASVNRSKVELRFYDPDSSTEEKAKADELGLQPLTIQKVDKGSAEVKQAAYFGLSLTVGSKSETIPVVVEAEKIEYQILSTLKKMLRANSSSGVAILKGTGVSTAPAQPGPTTGKDTFGLFVRQAFEPENGAMVEINPNDEVVPEDITTVLVVGAPALTDKGKYNIDQFLMRGGNLILSIKTMEFSLDQQRNRRFGNMFGNNMDGVAQASPAIKDLNTFFSKYGFEFNTDMVLEQENALPMGPLVQIEPGVIGRYHYPLWIILFQEGINKESPITKNTQALLLPWASTIEMKPEQQAEAKYTKLIESTEKADTRKDFIMIGENAVLSQEIKPNGKKLLLGLHVEGKLKSYFTKDTIPDKTKLDSFKEKTVEGKKSQIVVIGSPYIISDILAMTRDAREVFEKTNIPFFLNLLDALSGDTDLLAARAKESGIINLHPFSKKEEIILSVINVFLIPVALAVYAFFRLKKRNQAV